MRKQTFLSSLVLLFMVACIIIATGAGPANVNSPRISVITDTNGVLFDSASNLFSSNLVFLQPAEFPFASNILSGGIIPVAAMGRLTNHSDVTNATATIGGWLMWNGNGWTNFYWPVFADITNGFLAKVTLAGPVWNTNGEQFPDSTGTNWWKLAANPNMSTNVNWIGPTNPATGLIYGTNQLTGSATNVQIFTLANGSANQVLMMVGGIPTWANIGLAGNGPFTNLSVWSASTTFLRTNGQVPYVIGVSNVAVPGVLWFIDGTGDQYGRNAYFTNSLNVGATLLGNNGDIYATNHIVAYTTGVGFVGDGSSLTNLSVMNHGNGYSFTNAILGGTNINSGDISYPRYALSTLANGNNAGIVVGTNVYVQVSGPTGAFTVNGIAGGRDGKYLIIVNQTGQNMTLANESGVDATAANRITCLTGADKTVTGNSAAVLIYNGSTSRWIPLSFTQ